MLASPANHNCGEQLWSTSSKRRICGKFSNQLTKKRDVHQATHQEHLARLEHLDQAPKPHQGRPPKRHQLVRSAKWSLERKKRRNAFGILKLSLTEGPQDFISELKDPREAWIKLQELYQTNTLADVMVLRNKWSEASMTEGMDVSSFMHLIYGLLKELQAAGQQINDATTVHKILTHLPSRFDHFVHVVQNERNI